MRTIVTDSVKTAASFIKRGALCAFPTETVYGLGANAYDEKAVKKIFKAKGRPADNPLIVHIANKNDIKLLAREVTPVAQKIITKYFPGAVSVILKKNEVIPNVVTGGLDTIAIRMPSSKTARAFIKACGVPVAAPSANVSGSPSPTDFIHVLHDFRGKIPCVLMGEKARHGLESTVIDCTSEIPVILRPGVVTVEQLRKIDKRIKHAVKHGKVKSPGTKYRHYSPLANVKLKMPNVKLKNPQLTIRNSQLTAYIGLKKPPKGLGLVKECKSEADYARSLFAFFRLCDSVGIKTIYCQPLPEKGIGLAIMNRLKKASR
jgi:L-threonylcarbamoyladenylate synthase